DANQGGARVVEIHAELALRDIVERFGHRREVGIAARQAEIVRRRRNERVANRLSGGSALAVMVKHVWLNPFSWAFRSQSRVQPSLLGDEARSYSGPTVAQTRR